MYPIKNFFRSPHTFSILTYKRLKTFFVTLVDPTIGGDELQQAKSGSRGKAAGTRHKLGGTGVFAVCVD